MHHDTDYSSSLLTSMITAVLALIPDEAMSYAMKLGSVFVLAVAAELGRRLVTLIWKPKEKK